MRYIKGPDFPTGGIVVNKDDLRKIYETGSGKIRLRGKVESRETQRRQKAARHYRDSIYHARSKHWQVPE